MKTFTSDITRKVDLCFFALCLFPVFSVVSVIISYFFGQISGNADYTSDFYSGFVLPQGIYSLFGLLLFSFLPKIYGYKFSDIVTVKKVSPIDLLLSVPILLLINLFSSFSVGLISEGLSYFGISIFDYTSFLFIPDNPFQTILFFITVAVLPAISEEIVFRGVLVGLFKEFGQSRAIVFSSVAFALVHSTVQQIPTAFLVGLFLAYLYIKFNSLIPCIIGHLITNMISSALLLLSASFPEKTYIDICSAVNIILVISGIISAIIFIIVRFNSRKPKDTQSDELLSENRNTNAFLSSAGFWIFCLIMIGQTVFYAVVLSGRG